MRHLCLHRVVLRRATSHFSTTVMKFEWATVSPWQMFLKNLCELVVSGWPLRRLEVGHMQVLMSYWHMRNPPVEQQESVYFPSRSAVLMLGEPNGDTNSARIQAGVDAVVTGLNSVWDKLEPPHRPAPAAEDHGEDDDGDDDENADDEDADDDGYSDHGDDS